MRISASSLGFATAGQRKNKEPLGNHHVLQLVDVSVGVCWGHMFFMVFLTPRKDFEAQVRGVALKKWHQNGMKLPRRQEAEAMMAARRCFGLAVLRSCDVVLLSAHLTNTGMS